MHKLIELQKIIEERIGSLSEEVEIATNVKLNPLYIADVLEFESTPNKSRRAKIEIFGRPQWECPRFVILG